MSQFLLEVRYNKITVPLVKTRNKETSFQKEQVEEGSTH